MDQNILFTITMKNVQGCLTLPFLKDKTLKINFNCNTHSDFCHVENF